MAAVATGNSRAGSLRGRVALVAGATRGGGRGIAVELGAAGARVYCVGRSTAAKASDMQRAETIEETAALVTKEGGEGIALACDFSDLEQVRQLYERVEKENEAGLDVLVNCVWGGDPLTEWGSKFWELDLQKGFQLLHRAVDTHIASARFGCSSMVKRGRGLVFEIGDGDSSEYRGNLFYDLAKSSIMRLATSMHEELQEHGVSCIYLTPGFLRSEAMLEHFQVTAENWQEAVAKDKFFAESETPRYLGRAVVALAADPEVKKKSGKILATWSLAKEYDLRDVDGRQPLWKEFMLRTQAEDKAREMETKEEEEEKKEEEEKLKDTDMQQ